MSTEVVISDSRATVPIVIKADDKFVFDPLFLVKLRFGINSHLNGLLAFLSAVANCSCILISYSATIFLS